MLTRLVECGPRLAETAARLCCFIIERERRETFLESLVMVTHPSISADYQLYTGAHLLFLGLSLVLPALVLLLPCLRTPRVGLASSW